VADGKRLYGRLYSEALVVALQRVLRNEAREEIKNLYLATYDKLAEMEESEAGSAIKGKDPLSLKNLRGVFERQLDTELATAKVTPSGNVIINLMNKNLLGYAGATPTGPVETVDILAYYLEGVQGEHAFITVEQYKAGRKGGSRGNFGGRVGGGFMMERKNYEKEGWEKITGVPFAAVRHPISNQQPFNEFDTLAAKIDFSKYIKLALQQINQDFDD
jgi:hypothetical protein